MTQQDCRFSSDLVKVSSRDRYYGQSSSSRDGKHSPRHANIAKMAMMPTETFD
jgi:hypothetical protein